MSKLIIVACVLVGLCYAAPNHDTQIEEMFRHMAKPCIGKDETTNEHVEEMLKREPNPSPDKGYKCLSACMMEQGMMVSNSSHVVINSISFGKRKFKKPLVSALS